jgi:hypothetical protein
VADGVASDGAWQRVLERGRRLFEALPHRLAGPLSSGRGASA